MKSFTLRPNVLRSELLDSLFLRAIGYTPYSAASFGECFYVAHEIRRRGESIKAWVAAWEEMASRTSALARTFEQEENRIAAYNSYMRAWNYYRAAESCVTPSGSRRHANLYRESIWCFDKALEYASFVGEKIAIPYQNTSLPGYFFTSRSAAGEKRPTIIFNGGGDGAGEELFFLGGGPQALDYGFHVLVFHGPGHRGALHQDPSLVFRYDWEKVIGPVVDYCEARDDVDKENIGLLGESLGGFLCPRAVAFEPRIKAVAVNAIIPSYYQWWTAGISEQVPAILKDVAISALARLIDSGVMGFLSRFSPQFLTISFITSLMDWSNGTHSIEELLQRIKEFDNLPLAKQIKIPFLSLQSEGEGESSVVAAQEFFDQLGSAEKLHVAFKSENGADAHCTLNNVQYASDITYPWFQKYLAA